MPTLPVYVRGAFFLLFVLLLVAVLYLGQGLWITLITALVLSFLMLPFVRGLENLTRLPRWLSSVLGVLLVLAVVGSLLWFLSRQTLALMDDLPKLRESIDQKSGAFYKYVEEHWHISQKDQSNWVEEKKKEMLGSGANSVMSVFRATGAALASLILIPIIMFFMLLYRDKFNVFLRALCPVQYEEVRAVAVKISKVSQHYLRGIVTDIGILTILNFIGFTIFGLQYALLFAVMAAVLNIIPYIGVLVGSLLPVAMSLLTHDSPANAIGVFAVCVVVQFLDNNFIMPKVVGSSVNINPLASIIALLVGGMIWGLAGMVLSIPLAGMFKVVCDHVDSMRPYGYLLGEEKVYTNRTLYQRLVLPDFVKRALHTRS
jgi:predicted PurR-regulated permease PerM